MRSWRVGIFGRGEESEDQVGVGFIWGILVGSERVVVWTGQEEERE